MEIKVQLNSLRIAPRKVRLVLGLVRGLSVKEAQNQLMFTTKRSSEPVLKLLNSAIANAKNTYGLEEDSLYIKTIQADKSMILKRWLPRAMGRATPIHKKISRVVLVLEDREKSDAKKLKPKKTSEKIEQKLTNESKTVRNDIGAKENSKETGSSDNTGKQEKESKKPEMRAKDNRYQAGRNTASNKMFRRKSI